MINTPAFESLKRLSRLSCALDFLRKRPTLTEEYTWMKPLIEKAIEREKRFAENNSIEWAKKIENYGENDRDKVT